MGDRGCKKNVLNCPVHTCFGEKLFFLTRLQLKHVFILEKHNGWCKLMIIYFISEHNIGRVIKCFPFIRGAMWQNRGGRANSAQFFQQFNWMPLSGYCLCGAFLIRKILFSVTSNAVKTIWLNCIFSRGADPKRNYKRNVKAFLLLFAGEVCF